MDTGTGKALSERVLTTMIFLLLSGCGGGSGGGDGGGGNTVTANLQCAGAFSGLPASVNGTRSFEPIGPLDGFIRFSGSLTTAIETSPMNYEDFSNLAPYEGTLDSPSQGIIPISVLDATGALGDQMIIYLDVPTSGPPTILGQLTCVWS